ncbi:hypothetical protein [uncultured Hyphomonas sp.]|jgi:hypothetical protein|uniref:hypothetical protein n=1 Tax=uncultured Hyphomonas sp. TaxID=225298 RepID=UPI000C3B4C2B|nr:hypothetical protein [Hyphomonadaceae bacterium]MBA27156.1 hypothetical protein [Hyphomonadaceae bacterium]|tara:strand:- start:69 stop:455 length:387 start_codon:yes stop_codon:yes gene_type:complete
MIIDGQHPLPDAILAGAIGMTFVASSLASAWLWPKVRRGSWKPKLLMFAGAAGASMAFSLAVPLVSVLLLHGLAPLFNYELSYNGADAIALTLLVSLAPWIAFLAFFTPGYIFSALKHSEPAGNSMSA